MKPVIFALLGFLMLAPLNTACAGKVRPKMLALGSRPPDFSGTASVTISPNRNQPQIVSLRQFLHRKRIAVVFSPTKASLDQIASQGYDERDLVIIAVMPPKDPIWAVTTPPLYLLRDESGSIRHDYRAAPGLTSFYLIGKDGTIKMARHEFPSNKELFEVIDAMPMRQEEMKRHK